LTILRGIVGCSVLAGFGPAFMVDEINSVLPIAL
jgi:hypothetical protein